MVVMSIAGVDPSGGAGIFADIKTFQAIGVYGTGVITAITAQNPNKVYGIKPINKECIAKQIDSVIECYNITYIKTGMLYSKDILDVVSKKIEEYNLKAVVDPVMVATAGGNLSMSNTIKSFKENLLKNAFFTTPNVEEACKLTDINILDKEDAIKASLKLGKTCNNIITGGHLDGINVVNIDGEISIYKQELIKTNNTHGTGCNFSSAIVSYLEKGFDLENSISKAHEYVFKSIENGDYGTPIAPL